MLGVRLVYLVEQFFLFYFPKILYSDQFHEKTNVWKILRQNSWNCIFLCSFFYTKSIVQKLADIVNVIWRLPNAVVVNRWLWKNTIVFDWSFTCSIYQFYRFGKLVNFTNFIKLANFTELTDFTNFDLTKFTDLANFTDLTKLASFGDFFDYHDKKQTKFDLE